MPDWVPALLSACVFPRCEPHRSACLPAQPPAVQVCSRDAEAVVRRRFIAQWRQQGWDADRIGQQLQVPQLKKLIQNLESKIARRAADVGIVKAEDGGCDLEVCVCVTVLS